MGKREERAGVRIREPTAVMCAHIRKRGIKYMKKKFAVMAIAGAALCMAAIAAKKSSRGSDHSRIRTGRDMSQTGVPQTHRTIRTYSQRKWCCAWIWLTATTDNAAQLEAVCTFINKEMDYIIIAPDPVRMGYCSSGSTGCRHPVIIADREIEADASLYDAWVGTNTKNEGITAGNWLAEYLGDKDANILVIEGS